MAPSGARARFQANIAAIETSRLLEVENRPATAGEQAVLARWSSWGAIPQVFDESNTDWQEQRQTLRGLLDADAWVQARRTTINAHYTDAAYVQAVWDALDKLAFPGGRVLEPGAGAGTFIGLAPGSAQMVGVELDATTAAIARGLYPQAEIRTESFAETHLPDGYFDAVVGNVPFANVQLHDRAHNAGNHSIHNHFIIKSLALTRPGGMVAVLTSSFTMDAVNPAARREMNELGDLVGAVRLPNGAHRRAAGTEALTDLVLFRRREPGVPPRDVSWEMVAARQVDGKIFHLNTYFDIHPEHVLGDFHVGQGMYGNETVTVRTEDLAQTGRKLRAALDDIVERATERGDVFTAATTAVEQERARFVPADANLFDGSILWQEDTASFVQVQRGGLVPMNVPKSQATELRALLELRDGAKMILQVENTTTTDTAELDSAREDLRLRYGQYVDAFGPINRYTLRPTGRTDAGTGEAAMARITPRVMATLRQDPFSSLVRALERFDEETQEASPATLLRQRMNAPRHAPRGAENAADALAISLNESGRVDLDLIAAMLGVDTVQAREQLGASVYEEPGTGKLIHAAEYLAGDVRVKLDTAEEAVLEDGRFQPNVDALRAVQPEPVPIQEIIPMLGAVWISPDIHSQFLREILDDNTIQVDNHIAGTWTAKSKRSIGTNFRAINEFGTNKMHALAIAEHLMSQERIQVTRADLTADGKERRVVDETETAAANEKADKLQEAFQSWVWENPDRAVILGETYNRMFNSIVLRDYAEAGRHLSLPGMAVNIQLREHQRTAVARMVSEPAVGLFHQVGAGKTLEMVAGVSELRRMGMVNKPAVVVPNHMLEQFSREWLQAYPSATILAASSDDIAQADKRRLFVARAAANDWDAIILTQSAFKKISVGPATIAQYIERELSQARTALDALKGADGDRNTIKSIEKTILAREEKLKKKLDKPVDAGLTFEETGIDYLVIDEAHMYKNLATTSSINGASIDGSDQATDLHMKLGYLRTRHGDRVVTMATATPLANSVTEAHVMQRYLRPDLLEQRGILAFDAWAATFGKTIEAMEVDTNGNFRMKTRFAGFTNVPEMLKLWHVFADVKTAEDLNLPVPLVAARPADGKREPEVVVVEPTNELLDYMAALSERTEAVKARQVGPKTDNMLLISNDGRKAGLDLRMVDENTAPSGPVKLDAAVHRITREFERTKDATFIDDVTGEPSALTGGLQLVFLDLGTPNEKHWDAYHQLKLQLVDNGIPADSIRFMQEANNDAKKARMFAAARAGHIAVLIGSTAKMGVGTNVQTRLTAMHHVDCPWRPADLEQRDGRGIRQGNQNSEVAIYRYVTERSFDAYMWQGIARKATFINQVMRGRLDVREIEDIGDSALSAAEVKALATGNPLLLDHANADSEFQKLRRQEVAYNRGQTALSSMRADALQSQRVSTETLTQLRSAAARTRDTAGDAFRMTIAGRSYDKRPDAAEQLGRWVTENYTALVRSPLTTSEVGTIGGHTLHAAARRVEAPGTYTSTWKVRLELDGVPSTDSNHDYTEFETPTVGLIRTVENKVHGIDRAIGLTEQILVRADKTIQHADATLGQPFPHADELTAATRRLEDITAQMTAQQNEADMVAPTDTNQSVTVHNQVELDQALLGEAMVVVVDAAHYEQLSARISPAMFPDPKIEARGETHLRVYGFKIDVRDNSQVFAYAHSQVHAFDNAHVRIIDSSAETHDHVTAKAYTGSYVVAYDNSHIIAVGDSRIVAWGDSTVEARQSSVVESHDNSQVTETRRATPKSPANRTAPDPNTGPYVAPGSGPYQGPGMT